MGLVARSKPRASPGATAEAAAAAGRLRYVSDATPGIQRIRNGRGFAYRTPDGKHARDPATLRRIRSLVIPPAWTRVWICPSEGGHIQAVGRDAKGRKQYRYHARWRELRDETKYDRLIEFGQALARIRRRVAADLARPGLPRLKVLATVVRLLEASLIRIGNEEYARHNGSYGLTTLRTRHVRVQGARLRFEFRGKGGKLHRVDLSDGRLARIVRRCQELPGHELFQYVDESGHRQTIDSSDVNAYLREIAGREFTAKDFRTWVATVLAAVTMRAGARGPGRPDKRAVRRAVESVAERLGNTAAICRKSYIHPAILDAEPLKVAGPDIEIVGSAHAAAGGLRPAERAVLRFLQRARRSGGRPRDARSG